MREREPKLGRLGSGAPGHGGPTLQGELRVQVESDQAAIPADSSPGQVVSASSDTLDCKQIAIILHILEISPYSSGNQ